MGKGLIAALACVMPAFAGDTRQFDLRTTERLGNEIIETIQRPDHGATTPAKRKAIETAKAALRGKLYGGMRYEYIVLSDPSGHGLLVYALAISKKKDDATIGGHFRVSISAAGDAVSAVELLSQLIHQKADPGTKVAGIGASQTNGKLPVETWIYSSYLYRLPIGVAVMADGSIWMVANGRIVRAYDNNLKSVGDILNGKAPER